MCCKSTELSKNGEQVCHKHDSKPSLLAEPNAFGSASSVKLISVCDVCLVLSSFPPFLLSPAVLNLSTPPLASSHLRRRQMTATFQSRALTPLACEHYGVVCIRQNSPTSSAVNKLIFRTVQALLTNIFSAGPWPLLKHELKFISWAASMHSSHKSKKFTLAQGLMGSAEPPNRGWKVAFLFNSPRTCRVVNVLLED